MKVSDVTVGDEGQLEARLWLVVVSEKVSNYKLNSKGDGMKTCFQDTKVIH